MRNVKVVGRSYKTWAMKSWGKVSLRLSKALTLSVAEIYPAFFKTFYKEYPVSNPSSLYFLTRSKFQPCFLNKSIQYLVVYEYFSSRDRAGLHICQAFCFSHPQRPGREREIAHRALAAAKQLLTFFYPSSSAIKKKWLRNVSRGQAG